MHNTAAIYDARDNATPSQAKALAERTARWARFKKNAYVAALIASVAEPEMLAQAPLSAGVLFLDFNDTSFMWFHDLILASEGISSPGLSKRIRIDEIQMACARYYGVTRTDILSARRTANVVRPRQVGYFLSKVLTLKSLPEIGRRFGGRDHTTALWGIQKIERLRRIDPVLDFEIKVIAASVGGSLG